MIIEITTSVTYILNAQTLYFINDIMSNQTFTFLISTTKCMKTVVHVPTNLHLIGNFWCSILTQNSSLYTFKLLKIV